MIVSKKNKELYALIDKLYEHIEQIKKYAIGRTKSGRTLPNRLNFLEKHALEIYFASNDIVTLVQSMKRKNKSLDPLHYE